MSDEGKGVMVDMSDDLMERLFCDVKRRQTNGLDGSLFLVSAAAMMLSRSQPIGLRVRLPRKVKVSPAKLAKRKKQAAQKRARKIERSARK